MTTYEFNIKPVPKPRMTQADRRIKRPVVERYWDYKDNLRIISAVNGFRLPENNFHIIFYLPIPKNVKGVKRADMVGRKHQKRPDVDNLQKAFFDALAPEDSYVWDCRVTKLWGDKGKIIVRVDNG